MNKFGFDFKHLRGDLFGGITAGIVALPLALAFGLGSGLGATAGLYGAIFISFFAALFGGTNTQISGPTAPMTAVSVTVIAGIVAANDGDVNRALPIMLAIFLLAGLIQIGMGLLKLGQYIRFIPYPVVSGFMTGIGVIIIATQLLPLLGYYPAEDPEHVKQYNLEAEKVILDKIIKDEAELDGIYVLKDYQETVKRANEITPEAIAKESRALAKQPTTTVVGSLKLLAQGISNINYIDLVLGLLTILIIYGFKRITKAVPSALVALLVLTAGAYFLLPEYRTIGDIPAGFPELKVSQVLEGFNFRAISPFLIYAFALAALGAIDSLLTSIVADNMTKTNHKPNKELIGQGIGNSIAAFFGGIPGAGATIRTLVNIEAGGKTKLSGMIAGVLLLIVLLALGTLASKIPAAVLAGILITVGIGVMDYKGLRQIKQLPKTEVFVMLLVLVLTAFIGLIEAVLAGLLISSILFMKKIADVVDNRTHVAPLRDFSREIPWVDEGDILAQHGSRVYIKHLDGPLFFGFASRFGEMIKAMPEIDIVIMRMDKVPYVDQSGLYAMEDAVLDLQAEGIQVIFTDLHGQPQDMFEIFGIIPGLVEEKYSFEDFTQAHEWLEKYLRTGVDPLADPFDYEPQEEVE